MLYYCCFNQLENRSVSPVMSGCSGACLAACAVGSWACGGWGGGCNSGCGWGGCNSGRGWVGLALGPWLFLWRGPVKLVLPLPERLGCALWGLWYGWLGVVLNLSLRLRFPWFCGCSRYSSFLFFLSSNSFSFKMLSFVLQSISVLVSLRLAGFSGRLFHFLYDGFQVSL